MTGVLCQNGLPASPNRENIHTVTVPGTDVQLPVHTGPTGDLLIWFAGRWHREVEPLHVGWCWGWAYRDVRGSSDLSNHAGGYAIDLNAPSHGLGTNPSASFSVAQIAAIHRILADAQGCLRWGGDYVGRQDPMHAETVKSEAECARVLATVTGQVTPPAPVQSTTYGNLGIRGLDYSAATIPGATIKAAGYQFVIRYIDDPNAGLRTKHIRPAEYQDLVAAGVQVYLVFEVGTGDMLAGHDAGVANARRARAGADWIGYPAGAPIFMACDMHLSAAQLPAALAYIDGAVSVLGAGCGVYGFWELVDACIAQGKGRWFWQAGVSPDSTDAVHVWQRNDGFTTVGGVNCDINELRIPLTEENDMDARQDAMLTALYQQVSGSPNVGEWVGWPAWDGGSGRALTPVDYLRQLDVQVTGLKAELETVKASIAGLAARQAQQ